MARLPRRAHGSPSPLRGDGRSSGTRGRSKASEQIANADPSPRPAPLPTPLPQGERGNSILVARIGAAHGVRGEVRLHSFTEDPLAIAEYGTLETQDGARRFEIENLRPVKDCLIARFKGVAGRVQAEALRNAELFVPRERLPAIEEDDTFYVADLVGLGAVTPRGDLLGRVMAVHNFGAGDIIEIAPRAGGPTLLLPFTGAVVPEVDVSGGKIVVVMPDAEAIPPLKEEGSTA